MGNNRHDTWRNGYVRICRRFERTALQHIADSVEAGIKALKLHSTLDSELNNRNISESIAYLSLSLASKHFRDLISLPQALSYAQQSVRHYEKMFQRTGVIPLGMFVPLIDESLLLSLWEKN